MVERPGVGIDSKIVSNEKDVESALVVGLAKGTCTRGQCSVEYVGAEWEFYSPGVDSEKVEVVLDYCCPGPSRAVGRWDK